MLELECRINEWYSVSPKNEVPFFLLHDVETIWIKKFFIKNSFFTTLFFEVFDEEFGLEGEYWIESVEFSRSPQTKTKLTLMRPQDLLFDTQLPAGAKRSRIRKSPPTEQIRKPISYSETRLLGKDPKTGEMVAHTYFVG